MNLKPCPFYGGGVDFVKDTYMDDELLPCPFCESDKTEIIAGIDDGTPSYQVACMDCGASSGWWRDRNTAIEKWNTRHYPPEVEKAVERMKPKKPMYSYEGTGKCPVCRELVNTTEDRNFCWRCGQALDWSE